MAFITPFSKSPAFPVARRAYTRTPLQRRGAGDFPAPKPPAHPPLQRRGYGDFPKLNPPSAPTVSQIASAQASAPRGVSGPTQGQTPSPQATASAAAVAGAKADALAQYVAGITDPQERAYVEAQIGPQIVALNAQRDALMQQAKAQQDALQGFTAALVDQLKGVIGAASKPYADIAASQVAAGKAAGESLAAANPSGGTDAILNAIGAPQSQVEDLNKLNQDVFSGGGAVLTGTGGTIPSFQTAGEGLGVLGWATAQPGIAAAYGEENMRQLLAQQAQQQNQYNSDLQSVLAGIPKYSADYQTQQAQAKKDAENRAMSLYNAGLITQRELARQLGLPGWQKYPDQPRGDAAKPVITTGMNGHRIVVDPSTGKVISDLGATAAPKAPAATKLTFQTVNGRRVGVDPSTGRVVVDLGAAGSPKGTSGSGAKPHYYQDAAGREHVFDPASGTDYVLPNQGQRPVKPKYTPIQISRFKSDAADTAHDAFFGIKDAKTGQWVSPPKHYQEAMTDMLAHGIPLNIAQQALNRYWKKPGFERDVGQYSTKGRVYWFKSGTGRPVKPYQQRVGNPKTAAAQTTAYDPRQARTQTQPVSANNWSSIITAGAQHYGLDPQAVLAVAGAEGIGGGVGDSGTSFGPFQLHIGGALPRGKDRAWAESPAGIDYALRQIAAVARGLKGRAAIEAIVRRFERPANPDAEVARAWASYAGSTV